MKFYLPCIILCLNLISHAQTTVFSESFDEPLGSTSGTSAESIGWNASCPACGGSGDFYEITANGFEGQDTNGPATWESDPITIDSDIAYLNLQLNFQGDPYAGSNNLETPAECLLSGGCAGDISMPTAGGCNNCWDFLYLEVDYGSEQRKEVLLGLDATTTSGSVNTTVCNPLGFTTVTIRLVMSMWASSENMAFDDIILTGYSTAEANIAGITDPNCSTVLPITLTHFSAEASDNEISILSWSTSQEINNDYFSIERSQDGQVFQQIGTVNGNGNSSINHDYEFVDLSPTSGANYYRLKQVDFNGQFEYSAIRRVDFAPDSYIVYPNPVRRGSKITVEGKYIKNFQLYSMLGQLILDQNIEENQTQVTVETHNLSKGLYVLIIDDENYKIVVE